MVFNIEETEKIVLTGKAQDVAAACRTFMLANPGDGIIHIHAKTDGRDATADDFPLMPGETLSVPLSCDVLSVIGTGSLHVMYGHVWG